ncbi:MAG: hypothetical protein ABI554_10280 [Flavobacterium sp.]
MKTKLLNTLLFFTSPFIFSQTIKGKVVFNNYGIPKVEIINENSKTVVISDTDGTFSIAAKMNDVLIFIAKNYEVKKITVNPLIINDTDLSIELVLIGEELKEVVISNIENKTIWLTKEEIEQIKLNSSRPKPGLKIEGYKESPTLVGIDFIRIGKQIYKLLKKEENKKTELPKVKFKDLAKTTCNDNYFVETLKLKPEEIELFLEFCDADPKSKTIAETKNTLITMDFLLQKSILFKKQ